jgi:hypothetical protein
MNEEQRKRNSRWTTMVDLFFIAGALLCVIVLSALAELIARFLGG